MAGITMLN